MSAKERRTQHLDSTCAKKEIARLGQRGYATGVTKRGKISIDCLKDGQMDTALNDPCSNRVAG